MQVSSLAFLEYHLRTVLGNDSSAISTLRCLKLYLERLGCNHLDTDTMHSVAGSAFKLVCLHSFTPVSRQYCAAMPAAVHADE